MRKSKNRKNLNVDINCQYVTVISGGYSDGVPPLPIPNREVKPVIADGTAYSGRVGSRLFSKTL